MMFYFFKQQPGSPADSLLKTVSLYVIFVGLLVLVTAGLSLGLWEFMYKPLPLAFFVTGVTVTGAGCAGLMLDDACRKRCAGIATRTLRIKNDNSPSQ